MGDTVTEQLLSPENGTDTQQLPPPSLEGMTIAYGSLIIMAMIPIFVGSRRARLHQKQQKVCT